jgi:hypothetical protein
MHQIVNASLDNQGDKQPHGLGDQQTDESYDVAPLVTGKVWPEWAEAFEHP